MVLSPTVAQKSAQSLLYQHIKFPISTDYYPSNPPAPCVTNDIKFSSPMTIATISLTCTYVHILLSLYPGTKLDLRTDPKTLSKLEESHSPPITEEEGHELQRKLGGALYLECSSLTQTGLKEVFSEACRLSLRPVRTTKRSGCALI